jgi:5-methylthioadenosine/S-adenosylhomocysteine deaminase
MAGDPSAQGSKILEASVRIQDGKIHEIGDLTPEPNEEVRSFHKLYAFPGFIQTHVHLCQTLFRGLAEDRPLLPWLREKIWPFESGHSPETLRKSAQIAVTELLRGGCTTFQSMETVRHTSAVFDELLNHPVRAILGNALMDDHKVEGLPPGFVMNTQDSLKETEGLIQQYHGREERLFFAYSPRFVLSCTESLLREVGQRAKAQKLRIHTHASEHPGESQAIRKRYGKDNLALLDELGLLGPQTTLAHCVQVQGSELELLAQSGASVAHCPSTNLKLGSGIAPIVTFRQRGITIGLGADGAPCNNRLDPLTECRQAALLAQYQAGPGVFSAEDAVRMLTIDGARALGLEAVCGSLEVGKSADLVLVDLDGEELGNGHPFTKLVYSASREHIRHVLFRGEFVSS